MSIKATGIESWVQDDIALRQQLGINKYQTTVLDNPLSLCEWGQHFYEELLDAAVYMKRILHELEKKNV